MEIRVGESYWGKVKGGPIYSGKNWSRGSPPLTGFVNLELQPPGHDFCITFPLLIAIYAILKRFVMIAPFIMLHSNV